MVKSCPECFSRWFLGDKCPNCGYHFTHNEKSSKKIFDYSKLKTEYQKFKEIGYLFLNKFKKFPHKIISEYGAFIKVLFFIFLAIILLTKIPDNIISDDETDLQDQVQELEDQVSDLEQTNNDLETENEELKEKLDSINSVTSIRTDNYSDILDNVESESEY